MTQYSNKVLNVLLESSLNIFTQEYTERQSEIMLFQRLIWVVGLDKQTAVTVANFSSTRYPVSSSMCGTVWKVKIYLSTGCLTININFGHTIESKIHKLHSACFILHNLH